MASRPVFRLHHHPLAQQLGRYGVVGAVIAVVYFGLTLLLSGPIGLPIQAAIPISYVVAAALHFAGQRHFVFAGHRDQYELAAHQQAQRFVALNVCQYTLTAAITWVLDQPLGLDAQVSYVLAAMSITVLTFFTLRTRIFHAQDAGGHEPSETALDPRGGGQDVDEQDARHGDAEVGVAER
jgi:putative flippase GtrA